MTAVQQSVDELCVHTIRTLSIDAIQRANSGHPGLPMGAAPMAFVLWHRYLRCDPSAPDWADRDRFVLSAGHGSALQYSLLHLAGYDLSIDDLKAFRQWGSRTPGHPEVGVVPGVEATTGPLGQGSANAVGMAMAERALAHRFNRPGHEIVNHRTWALVSDGDLMEGISAEAASLAGHLRLGKLNYLYDANKISLDGPTSLCFDGEDLGARYRSYGWEVLEVEGGDTDLAGLEAAMGEARANISQPTLIIVRTTIGYGSPNKKNTAAAHGAPLGEDEVKLAKVELGFDPEADFAVPEDAKKRFAEIGARGARDRDAWNQAFERWAAEYPNLAAEWNRLRAGELPSDFDGELPSFEEGTSIATRSASGQVMNALAERVPELWGGDADLSCSTKTSLAGGGSFDGTTGEGRNVHFGVREHAMGAIQNGALYHGGLRPFTATFFVFSDYMRPAVRLAALCELPAIYVWTHDSIGVGEDGPTHQPVEHLQSLRAMPNLRVYRPGDARETAAAWCEALEHRSGPSALVLSRQNLPVLPGSAEEVREGVRRGARVVIDASAGEGPEVALIATGSEVSLAVEARERLEAEGVRTRVVSMPCWERFVEQSDEVKAAVLPGGLRARVTIEAGTTFGWERWAGDAGECVGVDRFGASAPGAKLFDELGMNVDAVVAAARRTLERTRG